MILDIIVNYIFMKKCVNLQKIKIFQLMLKKRLASIQFYKLYAIKILIFLIFVLLKLIRKFNMRILSIIFFNCYEYRFIQIII